MVDTTKTAATIPRSGSLENELNGLSTQFGGGAESQLAFDVFSMRINGVGTQKEFRRDRAGRLPTADHSKDLEFTVGQKLYRVLRLPAISECLRNEPFRDRCANVAFPSQNRSNGFNDFFAGVLLVEIPKCTSEVPARQTTIRGILRTPAFLRSAKVF